MSTTLTITDAARILGVKRQRVYAMLWDGDLRGTKDAAGHWQLDADEVQREQQRRNGGK